MNIYGVQKMTLLDYPGCVACAVFLSGCDFRCPFCHNSELVTGKDSITENVFFDFLRQRKGKLDGVAITGGEPCLRDELPAFIQTIKTMGYKVKLDTNGNHPKVLAEALRFTDYVAMDIKNSAEKYSLTIGKDSIDLTNVRESISLLMRSKKDYEFRTTVVDELHEPNDFHGIGEMVPGARKHFLQVFTDRDTVPFGNLHAPSKQKLQECARVLQGYVNAVYVRGVNAL